MNRTFFAFCIATLSVVVAIMATLFVLKTDIPQFAGQEDLQDTLHTVFDTVSPATVSISATSTGIDEITTRQWTGIIVRSDGIILTNKHLIGEGFTYTIELSDTTKISAVLFKLHPTLDLALLKIVSEKPLSLPVGEFITSQAGVRTGDIVIAIGNSLGLYPESLSQGIISGINRTVTLSENPMTGLIQTSIPLSLGSSWGPLIGTDGEIIGINTGIVWGSSQIGWALPLTQEGVDSFVK